MEAGTIKIAEDDDFERLKAMVESVEEWALEYEKGDVRVWTKQAGQCTFKMVKVLCSFPTVNPMDLYDVIHDPDYRKIWDQSMVDSIDIGHLNPNNDISYYAVSCPAPMKNRDFVLQRSWLDTGSEQFIINHSVEHKDFPPRRGLVRANSLFTGYLIRKSDKGCTLGYVTQSDLQGDLPLWLVNKCTHIFAPKYVRQLEKAALGYQNWKASHNPHLKPWHFPEQITSPKIPINHAIITPVPRISVVQSNVRQEECSQPQSRKSSLKRKRSTSLKGSTEESMLSSNKNQLLSCLNFSKICFGRNSNSDLS